MIERSGFLQRHRELLVVTACLVVPLGVFLANRKPAEDHHVLDRALVTLSAPVQHALYLVVDGIASLAERYVLLVGLHEENQRLLERVAGLHQELAGLKELRAENERLHALLGLKEGSADLELLPAPVLALGSSPFARSARIGVGSSSGVPLGAAVLTAQGVVGRVTAVAASSSDVSLLTDPATSIDVVVQRTRSRGRLRGIGEDQSFDASIDYLRRLDDVKIGDIVVTSGAGEHFPKGFVVGDITEIERPRYGLFQEARVAPRVDFDKLEEVLVVVRVARPGSEQEPQ